MYKQSFMDTHFSYRFSWIFSLLPELEKIRPETTMLHFLHQDQRWASVRYNSN